jgi:hypothetical protein
MAKHVKEVVNMQLGAEEKSMESFSKTHELLVVGRRVQIKFMYTCMKETFYIGCILFLSSGTAVVTSTL